MCDVGVYALQNVCIGICRNCAVVCRNRTNYCTVGLHSDLDRECPSAGEVAAGAVGIVVSAAVQLPTSAALPLPTDLLPCRLELLRSVPNCWPLRRCILTPSNFPTDGRNSGFSTSRPLSSHDLTHTKETREVSGFDSTDIIPRSAKSSNRRRTTDAPLPRQP